MEEIRGAKSLSRKLLRQIDDLGLCAGNTYSYSSCTVSTPVISVGGADGVGVGGGRDIAVHAGAWGARLQRLILLYRSTQLLSSSVTFGISTSTVGDAFVRLGRGRTTTAHVSPVTGQSRDTQRITPQLTESTAVDTGMILSLLSRVPVVAIREV
jgi:hypothetical protein